MDSVYCLIFIIYCYIACSEIDIVRELKKHQSTINFHLKKLIEDGLVEKVPHNKELTKRTKVDGYVIRSPSPNEKFYCLKDAEQIQSLLIKYQDSLITDSVSDCILY